MALGLLEGIALPAWQASLDGNAKCGKAGSGLRACGLGSVEGWGRQRRFPDDSQQNRGKK
jgi:hypothetical protein